MPFTRDARPTRTDRRSIHCRRTALTGSVVLAAALVLTACGGSGSNTAEPAASTPAAEGAGTGTTDSTGSPATAGSSATTGAAIATGTADPTGTDAGGSGTGCAQAPATLVGNALGMSLGAPEENTSNPGTVVCTYKDGKGHSVIVRIQSDQTADGFATSKAGFSDNGMSTANLSGLGDEAYSSTLKSVVGTQVTVVARKGSREVLVTARASLAQEKGLVSTLLAAG